MKMVHFMVRKEGRQEPEWSSDYSFLLPLSGTVKLFLKKRILELKKGDVVMIEPFQYFSLSDVSGSCLLCGVDLTKLMSGQGAAPGRLECNSVMELHKERYHEVTCDILHLVQEIQQENVCAYVREMKWSYQLLEHLLRDFRVETEISDTEFPMMQNVLFYIFAALYGSVDSGGIGGTVFCQQFVYFQNVPGEAGHQFPEIYQ